MDKSWSKDIKYEIECISKREREKEIAECICMISLLTCYYRCIFFCNLDKKGCLTSFQYHNIPNLDWHVLFYVWIKNEDRLKKTEESYGNEVNILRPFILSDMT